MPERWAPTRASGTRVDQPCVPMIDGVMCSSFAWPRADGRDRIITRLERRVARRHRRARECRHPLALPRRVLGVAGARADHEERDTEKQLRQLRSRAPRVGVLLTHEKIRPRAARPWTPPSPPPPRSSRRSSRCSPTSTPRWSRRCSRAPPERRGGARDRLLLSMTDPSGGGRRAAAAHGGGGGGGGDGGGGGGGGDDAATAAPR